MSIINDTLTQVEWWSPEGNGDGVRAGLDVERDESGPGRVAIHTMVDGTGSHSSYYLDRESAIELARNLLQAVALD